MTVLALDLDDDLINHLANPDSVRIFRSEGISKELIEDERAKEIFDWQMDHVREHGKPATTAVLENEFSELEIAPEQTVVRDLIQRLRERYARNNSRQILHGLAGRVKDKPASLGIEMIQEGRKLSHLLTPRGDSFGPGDEERAVSGYHQSVLQGRGASLGFCELDDHFYGQKGLTFMVGAPKSMKSWFTIKAAFENILDGRMPYLYSLELPAKDATFRLLCMAAGVPFWRYIKHSLTDSDLKKIKMAADLLGEYRIEKPARGTRTPEYLIERARDWGADVIFIDQLQYLEHRKMALGGLNDPGIYWDAINQINDLTDDGPIWVVHQFNRSVMGADKLPDMQQIKGSAAIEECATVALGLWSSSEMRKSGLIHLGTLVSRNVGYATWECQVDFKQTNDIRIIGEIE